MTCVLPAWTIREVLDMPKLADERRTVNERLSRKIGDTIPEPEAIDEPSTADGDEVLRRMLNTPPKREG